MGSTIDASTRKPVTTDDYEAPIPHDPRKLGVRIVEPSDAPISPFLSYSPTALANPQLRAAPATRLVAEPDWHAMALPPAKTFEPKTTSEKPPIATPTNAQAFVDRGIMLSAALKDAAFTSTPDLERFIDSYLACSTRNPALHADAEKAGPELLANRLVVDAKEQEHQVEEQRMQDRVALFQVRPPLIIQQRAAVGEVAIPVAKASAFVMKLAPVVGQLGTLAEVASGRSLLGLGDKLDASERALDAALLVAPFAAKALGKGVRASAELIAMARETGRSTDELRALCETASTVTRNEMPLREAIAAAREGRTLTAEQRAAVEAISMRRRVYQPTTTFDPSMAAGAGRTNKYGDVRISPHGSPKDVALATAHESVHSVLSPKTLGVLREFRADVRMTAYQKSSLCRYLEEALAESYAQVKVNGLGGLPAGIKFPITRGYVTLKSVITESAIATLAYGGSLYGVYVVADKDENR